MVRIFSILSAFTVLLLFVAGTGTYWLSKADIDQANLKQTEALAKGMALSIKAQINTLQEVVTKMAKAPESIEAIKSESPFKMIEAAAALEKFLPKVMKLRVLPANITKTDESDAPHMGNADLIMVQESLTLLENQRPVIQGQGKNRHLAITSVINNRGQPIGVILASLKFDFLQTCLNAYQVPNGYIELKQNNVALATAGDLSNKESAEHTIEIAGTSWSIHYWNLTTINQTTLLSFFGMILFPAFLTALACFIGYRKLNNLLQKDHDGLSAVIKDLSSDKNVGSYPLHFKQMKVISTEIIQLKRGMNRESDVFTEEESSSTEKGKNTFEETLGVSFLNSNISVEEVEGSVPESPPSKEQKKSLLSVAGKPVIRNEHKALSIFKANDIRGVAEKSLTKEIVFNIGCAIGSIAKEQGVSNIVMGRDARLSSDELAEAVAKGIVSTSVNVLDLGLVPSSLVYFVAHHSEGKSGVMISGSHNPPEYNGLKIVINGKTIANEKLQHLAQRVENKDFLSEGGGAIEKNTLFVNEYIGTISEDIHIVRPMKVVVDCSNGVTSKLAPTLLKTLGCEVVELFCEMDGTFPNHQPDINKSENLRDLIDAVKRHKADVGIAFDGAGDRLGVVDCKGNIIWPDRQIMLFSKDILTLKPGAEIIYDVKCSRHLGEQIVKNGGRPIMWKTGYSFMKEKMKETGAALAGEMSGHIFFNDRWFGFDDALYAASRLIEILSADTRNSDEVFSDFPNSPHTPEFIIELDEKESTCIMEKLLLEARFVDGKIIKTDGMRVEFPDGWGLIRLSNSMPALSLRFEAENTEALQRIQTQFKELIVKVKPDISLPF